jgi:carnitine 3-dehydrogenase
MARPRRERVAIVGCGLIGASWAALFLGRGHDVVATDPAPGAEARLRDAVRDAWTAVAALGLAEDASPDRLAFDPDPARAVADADFVQENGPERLDVKRETYRLLDAAARPEIVLASSSSGLKPSDVQGACAHHPERVLIGHPFNPPHLVPLVEVVGGEKTSEAAIEAAMAFYARAGKHPIRIRRELTGHVANRLQAALWREAFHLVETGAASAADVDAAIAHGPGLRWALMGPCLLNHLSGGPGGIRHTLGHLGPLIQAMWDDLGAPTVSPALAEVLAAGIEDELAGRSLPEVVAERDAVLVELVARKRQATALP